MSVELIGEWLTEYGVASFDGACTFSYKDTIDFSVEVTADETHVILSSTVGEIPEQADSETLQKLLKMNYLGIKTRGATLSLDETGTNIVLWISLPIERLDPEQFENMIGVFLDCSEELALAVR